MEWHLPTKLPKEVQKQNPCGTRNKLNLSNVMKQAIIQIHDQMQHMPIKEAAHEDSLSKISNIYLHFDFRITHILVDGEFENIDTSAFSPGVSLNIVADDVTEVECYFWTIKEFISSEYT